MKTLIVLILAATLAACAGMPGSSRTTGDWKPVNPPTQSEG